MTQENTPILFEIKDGYAVITLNRPKQLNSFNADMHVALQSALDEVESNDNIRALLITGAGRGFCAGQDLGDRDPTKQEYDLSETITTYYNPLILRLEALKKPIVVAVNGVAAGAGIGLTLAGDIALSANNAKFAMAFGKIGLVPDSGLTWRLVKLLGVSRAKALALTNATLTAEEALDYGLIWRTYEPSVLKEKAEKLTQDLAHGPQVGTRLTIEAMNQAQSNTLEQQLALEANSQREAGYSADYKEGVSAFLEKRPAVFYKKG
ncbi:MAG: 2-(1,2-epoxy-1,2-dihydrophenyl)acetyl-CoA isomerase [Gammaproteobacteria bacterium]|nr:MAG: 2-(1,2-epoxy-1,2-dihydrophenyl)acetyl-CoA isomerase [Gammaproteobacteria bacterium]